MRLPPSTKATIIVSIAAVILSSCLGFYFGQLSDEHKRDYELDQLASADVLSGVSQYASYYTVNWKELDGLMYSSTPCEYDKYLDQVTAHHIPDPCILWSNLQQAKTDFHRKTIKARVVGSDDIKQALIGVENGFDDVFGKIASEDWYSRSFVDNYNEVMSGRFARLESVLHEAVR